MYVLPQKLAKMTFVGTTAIFFATVNALKVVPYFALGQFSTKGLGTSLALLPLAIATNMLGFWLVRITPQELFYKITMVADVPDLDRTGAQRHDGYFARLTERHRRAAASIRYCEPDPALSGYTCRRSRSTRGTTNGENALRHRSRPQSGQFPAADAARLSRARGRRVPGPHRHHPRAAAAHLRRVLCARAPARLGAGEARHQARRHRLGDARQHAGDAGMPLRRADDARRAQHAQHPARCADHRLLARPCRGQGA